MDVTSVPEPKGPDTRTLKDWELKSLKPGNMSIPEKAIGELQAAPFLPELWEMIILKNLVFKRNAY
jgi:hypothetical protein